MKQTSTNLREKLDAAERQAANMKAAAAEALRVREAAQQARRDAAGASDEALDRLDHALAAASTAFQRAEERQALAERAAQEARDAYQVSQRDEQAVKAHALRNEKAPQIVSGYADAARAILTTIRTIAATDADLERLESLPEGRKPESIEKDARFQGWLQETEISRKRVTLWANEFGEPLSEQPRLADIREDRDGHFLSLITTGTMSQRNGRLAIQQRDFERVEFRPDRLNRRRWHQPLFKEIFLPAVSDPGERLWPPRAPLSNEPEAIMAAADAALVMLDDQLAALRTRRDDRPIEVRFEPVRSAQMDESEDALDTGESAPDGDDGDGEFEEGLESEKANGNLRQTARRLAANSGAATKPALRAGSNTAGKEAQE